MLRPLLLLPLLALGACGVSVSVDGNNVSMHSEIAINEADFDLDGVKLYPGSVIRDFTLDAQDRIGEKNEARVSILFDSPASLDKVQAWFRQNLAEHGYKFAARGTGFAGTAADGDKMTLELSADGPDKTKGRMTVGS